VNDVVAGIAAAISATWVIVTVVDNIPAGERLLMRVIRASRPFSLIPHWAFFAPHPATWDVSLVYRDRVIGGSCSPWLEAAPAAPRSASPRWIWNPGRASKAVADASTALVRAVRSAPAASLPVSVPYLLLLNKVSALPVGPGVVARQFALVRHSRRDRTTVVIFVSGFHAVVAPEAAGVR
jgi:hypothetical protein